MGNSSRAFVLDQNVARKAAFLASSTGLMAGMCLIGAPALAEQGGSSVSMNQPWTPAVAQDSAISTFPTESAEGGGEIIVTAQRRSERLVDVPASITAISAEQLSAAGISGLMELPVVTPGLVYNVTPPQAMPTIRGVGSAITTTGNDPAVALYIDGVYMPSQTANVLELNNVERVEVLKGPQGTLYGRNATGGAILVNTRRPTFDFEARVNASYGSFDEVRADAFVNTPIGNTFAMNASVSFRDDNGYSTNIVTGNPAATFRDVNGRVRLLWQPTEALSFILTGNHTYRNDTTGYALRVLDGNTALASNPALILPTDRYDVSLGPSDPVTRVRNSGASLLGTYDLGRGTLTSVTSYQHTRGKFLTDTDRTNILIQEVDIDSYQNTFQQDLTFASEDFGPFSIVVGGSAYFDTAVVESFFSRSPTANTLVTSSRVQTDAYSGFVELGYSILDNLHLLGGIRYSTETKDFRANNATVTNASRATFSAWTPRFAVRYEAMPNFNIYGSYTRGFKSGVYNTFSVSTTPVLPEDIDAFEVGTRYSRRGITASAALFTYNYRNVQVTAVGPTGVASTLNAARQRIKGAEIEIGAQITPNFFLRGTAAYTHARYSSFPNAQFYVPIVGGGNTQIVGDATGNRVPRVPDLTAGLDTRLNFPLGSGQLEVSGAAYYTGSITWSPSERLVQGDYVLVNASIGWTSPDERWRFTLWGRNLTDRYYYMYLTESPQGDGANAARPRTVGVSVGLRFN